MIISAANLLDSDNMVYKIPNKILDSYVKKMCKEADGCAYVTEHLLQSEYPCRYMIDGSGFTGCYSNVNIGSDEFFDQKWNERERPQTYHMVHTGYMESFRFQ